MVGQAGIEPATCRLGIYRSVLLSYWPKCFIKAVVIIREVTCTIQGDNEYSKIRNFSCPSHPRTSILQHMMKSVCSISTKEDHSMRDMRGLVCALLCAGVMAGCLTHPTTVTKAGVPAGMVLVQGGALTNIGNGAITVDSFYIGTYEVTWAEWQTVRAWAATHGYDIGSVGVGSAANHPVHTVNWYDCVKWCNARSQQEGRTPVYTVGGVIYKSGQINDVAVNASATGYRLPTDAQWEFAARGGTRSHGYEYSGGNDLNVVGWYWENATGATVSMHDGRGTWPVGQKTGNELGLYDMSGNVWEWCLDWYPGYKGSSRVIRGGSWVSNAYGLRSAPFYPDNRRISIGFRAVLPPGQR